MHLFLLCALTMVAFAANSVLNRIGIVEAGMDPVLFGAVRLGSGALVLLVLASRRSSGFAVRTLVRVVPMLSLFVYIFGFSIAYVSLDAGAGALILFGMVQITMFAGALWLGETVPVLRWIGAAVAFAGLIWVLWPGSGTSMPLAASGAMAIAGVGWGIYSLAGRGSSDPLGATAVNFSLAAPLGILMVAVFGAGVGTPEGWGIAVLSGAVTSGIGYALWYAILPKLGATRAAAAQLTVPVIAIAGGAVFLAEVPGIGFLIGASVVLAGVALSALAK